jgi:hypothetical protein
LKTKVNLSNGNILGEAVLGLHYQRQQQKKEGQVAIF